MQVYEALAKGFQHEGTNAVFGLIGETNQHWVDAMVKLGIPYYAVRHEGPGLAMAEAWGQVSGQPGVVSVASGCGVAHLGTQMLVASRSHSPLVAFCGDGNWGDEDDNQRMDQQLFAAATEAAFVRVTSADRAYESVRQAFYIARHESRPVMLSAPKDVQLQPFDDFDEYSPASDLMTNRPIQPNPGAVHEATEIIASSRQPVILVGQGAQKTCDEDSILELAERIGAVVATSILAMNWLRDKEPFHAGIAGLFSTGAAMNLFRDTDCVIAIGASLNRHTVVHGYLFPEAKFIHIDHKSQVIMGDGRSADCYIQADAALAIEQLTTSLSERSFTNHGYRTPENLQLLKDAWVDSAEFEIPPDTLDPREVYRVLDEGAPSNFGLNIGGGHQAQIAAMTFVRQRPWILASKQFGAMGKGLIATIGACLATGTPAIVAEGDGGFMLHLAEFETAVRYNVPVLVAVMNDQGLSAEVKKAWSRGLDPGPSQMTTPDLGALGVAMGGRGEFIRTLDQLRDAVARFVADPAPTVLDIRIPEDLPSIPHRRKHLGVEV